MNQYFKWSWALVVALLVVLSLNGAWAEDVSLGSGDQLKITVYNNPDLTLETKVSENGNITFPLIGTVALEGLSTSGAEKKIADLLKQGGFVRSPEVNILVVTVQSQQVSILGQVNKPGRYPHAGA